MKYNLAVCGGTFDHFHKGHREFLRFGLSISNKLLLGLTTDKFVANKGNNESIEDYKTRKKQIEDFLTQEKAMERVSIEPIDDTYIPKIWEDLPIESIIVSKNTIEGARQINLKRIEQKKYPLNIEIVSLVKNINNEYISSSRIRNGEINREGRPYINPLWLRRKLCITEKLRKKLKRPFGSLLQNDVILGIRRSLRLQNPCFGDSGQARMTLNICLITVGDVTTKTFNKLKVGQNISFVDFKVARQKRFSSFKDLGFLGDKEVIWVNNPAGYLTPDLFTVVSKLFKEQDNKRIVVKINGEEDLCVLPLVLVSPLNSVIFYGQPNEGMVKVTVSEDRKNKAYQIVNKFSVCTRGH